MKRLIWAAAALNWEVTHMVKASTGSVRPDSVAVEFKSQDGTTNTYELDAGLRHRHRTRTGSEAGIEVYHYSDSSDSPTWVEQGAGGWSRNIEVDFPRFRRHLSAEGRKTPAKRPQQ